MPGTGAEIHVTPGANGTVRVAPAPLLAHDGLAHEGLAYDGLAYDSTVAAGPDSTRSVLDVAGAVLIRPVLGDPGLPVAEIHDVGRAQQWLWAVYGPRVAAAVHACAAGAQEPRVVGEPADHPTALANAAARLGFGHWAARWWPASYTDGIPALEQGVLGLELAALTHRCQQLFGDLSEPADPADSGGPGVELDDCAADLIEEHRAALDPLIQWWRAEPQPASTARQLESVLRLVDDAADCAGLDGPDLRRLRASLDAEREPGRTVSAGAPVGPGALFARGSGYALAAGDPLLAGGRVIARGHGTNDWRRCPPGFVDAAEDAVSWTARALGARRRLEVEVVAHVTAPVVGVPLVAEVRVNGGRAHRVPLARRDDVWTGRTDLDQDTGAALSSATVPPRIEVGVLMPGFDPGPGPGPDGRADRDAIRALARRRLTDATRPRTNDADGTGPFLAETLAAAATDEDY
ncbi:hypothetical protein [Streptomyces sp. NPDC005374]|uniref:hypothetical protein n=1 Tax=Streptomyces sp. NPDC005374 TaxID=3364713 RepID=UPI00368D61D1